MTHPTLSHFSDCALVCPESRSQSADRLVCGKPSGLWVSADGPDDWKTWCVESEFRVDHLVYQHRVELSDPERIMWLTSPADVLAFSDRFSVYPMGQILGCIDWVEVARSHAGIVIAPYQHSLRFQLMWYYGWDCASGCIWDATAIKSLTLEAAA